MIIIIIIIIVIVVVVVVIKIALGSIDDKNNDIRLLGSINN